MVFGFECCSAAQEERDSHLADKRDMDKQKKSRGSRRSRTTTKANFVETHRTFDDGWIPTPDTNKVIQHETIEPPDLDLPRDSLRPPRASVAANNVLVGEPCYPASGSLNPRSAFAPTPPPDLRAKTRFQALPRVIPVTIVPARRNSSPARNGMPMATWAEPPMAFNSSASPILRP
jgi:hypothetical protein